MGTIAGAALYSALGTHRRPRRAKGERPREAMNEDLSPQEMIRANAEMMLAVARKEFDPHIGFDAAGVHWLDGYIQGLVEKGDVEATEELCDNLGSYLGTCIIETYGGAWQDTEHGWAVVLDGDLAVFPFNKTLKHLTEGAGDSVLGLFNSISPLIAHANGTAAPAAVAVVEAAEPAAAAPVTETTEPAAAAAVDTAKPSEVPSKSLMGKLGRFFRR